MKRHKVGETIPNISKEQALIIHDNECECTEPYIISKPLARIEQQNVFSLKYYSESCWQCLNCKWESDSLLKRTT